MLLTKTGNHLEINLDDLISMDKKIFVEFKKSSLPVIEHLIISKFESLTKFSKLSHIRRPFLFVILKGIQNRINLKFAHKITELLGIKLEDIVYRLSTGKRKKSYIPMKKFPLEGTPILACLVGHAFGDGNIGKNSFKFTNHSKDLLNEVISNVRKLGFSKNIFEFDLDKRISIFTVRLSLLVNSILILAGAPVGNKVVKKFEVPRWIKNGNKSIKRSFLRAIFDDEGSVKINSREITIKFSKVMELQDNLSFFLDEIRKILEEFNIDYTTIGNDLKHIGKNGITQQKLLRICGIKNFINFKKFIGFTIPHKSMSLKTLIFNTQIMKLRKGEAEKKIMSELLNRKLTIPEISRNINITPLATWKHLIKFEKKNLITRIRSKRRNEFDIWMVNDDKDTGNHIGQGWRR